MPKPLRMHKKSLAAGGLPACHTAQDVSAAEELSANLTAAGRWHCQRARPAPGVQLTHRAKTSRWAPASCLRWTPLLRLTM